MTVRDALKYAQERGLDLVKVAPNAEPPVCKVMDFGKFKYEQNKLDKEAKKKQTIINIKEMKFRPNIEEHDYAVKTSHVRKFLEAADKVKVTVMFRGREVTHSSIAEKLLLRMADEMSDVSQVERAPKLEGRNMIMILMPRANKKETERGTKQNAKDEDTQGSSEEI